MLMFFYALRPLASPCYILHVSNMHLDSIFFMPLFCVAFLRLVQVLFPLVLS